MSSMPKPLTETEDELLYPESDGQPMGETDWHIVALILLREGLEDVFVDRDDVYIGSDLFLYYVKGDPSANTAPDAMVVKGVAKHFRRIFKTWLEKAVPRVIFEICSRKTWRRDLGERRQLYERLGVVEYFVFDPEARYLKPPLRGFRLRGGKYVPLAVAADGSLASKELGLRLQAEGHMLRLVDARTGQAIPTRTEARDLERQSKDREKQRADQEKQRADALEAELTRLRNESSKRRGKNR
jgi:Uma2 family endonuclease